jgi:hypothetical protein
MPTRPGPIAIPKAGPGAAPARDPIPPLTQPGSGSAGAAANNPISQGSQPPPSGGVDSPNPKVNFPATASGCFIATAAFASSDAEEVVILRRFRDEHLIGSRVGDWFVKAYYRVSPPIAEAIAESPMLRAMVRGFLRVVVFAIQSPVSFVALLLMALALRIAPGRWRRIFRNPALIGWSGRH